VSRVIFKT